MNTGIVVNTRVLEMIWLVCSSQVVSSTLDSSNSLQQVIEELTAVPFHNWTSWCSQLQVLTCYVNDGSIREDYII